ncbi:MAG: 4'-phosphopantetheinyl transferase superfamily protein [Agathobacter sp.]|nr:4'-phosphopantetheinyl transferase superfamily protein [Agathobacter sp.]MBQ2902671.1 4'-phosphopantetheinyl transferase superfamily protein [Agathobacter sp.]
MLKLYYGHIKLVKDPEQFDKWFEKMDGQRKDKILRCKNEVDKQRSLLAGILLHFGLENNRDEKQIFYSISHSGNYVICVLSDRSVGIDIENKFRSIFSEAKEEQLDKIARKCFTMGESIYFLSAEEEEKQEIMLKLWTRKESYSKAIGKGLGIDFSLIDTQKKDALYWSDWLEDGYYCSLYVEDGFFGDLKLQEIVSL